MFEVGVVVSFRATHRLYGDFGPAKRKHGHNYRVVVTGKGLELRQDGTLCDITTLEKLVRGAVGSLRFQDLNGLPAFSDRNSTAEVLAQYLYDQVAPSLRGDHLACLIVRVWESSRAYGSYEGALS